MKDTKLVTKAIREIIKDLDNLGNSFDNSIKYDLDQKQFIKKQNRDISLLFKNFIYWNDFG